jgi:hypothetical protein
VDWGFDGLKLDGQHMNGVPEPVTTLLTITHKSPEDSVEALPDFFREIYETAQKAKPGAHWWSSALRHGLFLLHHAAFQHVGGFRSERLVPGKVKG